MQILHAIISVDISNFFNQVAYPYTGLVFQQFGLSIEYITTFFNTIQDIKMYLLTLFRILTNYYSGSSTQPFQGII